MNRATRHLLVVLVAVITAGVASFGVYRAVTRIPVREVEVAHTFVVVASRSLPPGVRLSKSDLRLAAWPASNQVPGSFSKIEAVVDRALLASVVENEPLVQGKLASVDEGAGLPPAIPPGMRAMSVKVNEVIGVAGFVDPGMKVDLVVTIRKREETTARTVVSNVQVLSSGTRYEQERTRAESTRGESTRAESTRAESSTAKPAAPPAVVTLLVTPQDAERIALAQAEGQIMLVLRNPLDNEPTATGGVRTAGLFGEVTPEAPVVRTVSRPRPPEPAVVSPAPPGRYTVEAIRAAKRTEEEVVQ
jgi:pilus assembly protein CpaB